MDANNSSPVIRLYEPADRNAVRALFTAVNRELAPPDMRDAFEDYIARALTEEIDRIPDYYASRDGAFWVVAENGAVIGMFGIERSDAETAELRRMYVARQARRRGLAARMLAHAEQACRDRGFLTLSLSTSELQQAALGFYRAAGYRLTREEVAAAQTNKTVGGAIRRSYFEKRLR